MKVIINVILFFVIVECIRLGVCFIYPPAESVQPIYFYFGALVFEVYTMGNRLEKAKVNL